MCSKTAGVLSVLGRICLCAIFLMSALGNKIPKFDNVAETMGTVGIPSPRIMLMGAIAFLIAGSVSIILGLFARFGALLLFVFLVLATYYFHAVWKLAPDDPAFQAQMVNFLKNVGLAGAMLMIMGNGAGAMSLDRLRSHKCCGHGGCHAPTPEKT